MISTMDLIEALKKFPTNTEWEVVGNRCIACEYGVIDLESMVGNDMSFIIKDHKRQDKGRYKISVGRGNTRLIPNKGEG